MPFPALRMANCRAVGVPKNFRAHRAQLCHSLPACHVLVTTWVACMLSRFAGRSRTAWAGCQDCKSWRPARRSLRPQAQHRDRRSSQDFEMAQWSHQLALIPCSKFLQRELGRLRSRQRPLSGPPMYLSRSRSRPHAPACRLTCRHQGTPAVGIPAAVGVSRLL